MKTKQSMTGVVCVLIAFGVGCSRNEAPQEAATVSTAAPEPHDAVHESHDEHAISAEAPALPAGQLWSTDEPLRAAMLRVRSAVQKSVPAYERGQLPPIDAQGLAIAVEENVAYMIANCKLEPKPDAALHVLIGRMLHAAAALKKDPAADAGLPQLVAVLRDYQATFDHPDWE